MTALQNSLGERREEFDAHFTLARALEDRMMMDADTSVGSLTLSIRHINTIKSGLVVHLYNIEESIMSQALDFLGDALGSVSPHQWTEHSLREWLRESVASRVSEGNEDTRLATIYETSSLLMKPAALGPQRLKKPPGTWDDKAIALFMKRASVSFSMPTEIWRRIAANPIYGDKTPMQFLADRRNAIAHGRRSFEEGASDLGLTQIRNLADVTLEYLQIVAKAFENHVATNAHFVATA